MDGWIIDDDQQHISVGVCPSLAVVVTASSTKQFVKTPSALAFIRV